MFRLRRFSGYGLGISRSPSVLVGSRVQHLSCLYVGRFHVFVTVITQDSTSLRLHTGRLDVSCSAFLASLVFLKYDSKTASVSPFRICSTTGAIEWTLVIRNADIIRRESSNPGNTLFVTGLSTRVTERELEDHFSKEGKVADCFLVVEPRTRISRGFAFVTMDNVEDADSCIKHLNQSVLEGRYITVEKVKPQAFDLEIINGKSRRRRPRTPTPGHYLGMKSTRDSSYRHDRGRYRGGYSRDDYGGGVGGGGGGGGGYRRSPKHSPYRGSRGYSPRHSPYVGRSRRERSRSLPYSPYESPDRGFGGRRSNGYQVPWECHATIILCKYAGFPFKIMKVG
ncbi:hypothetical protein ACLOJK_018150 [Asimina triloba]